MTRFTNWRCLLRLFLKQLFAEAELIIGEYSTRRSRGEYSLIITEPEANYEANYFLV